MGVIGGIAGVGAIVIGGRRIDFVDYKLTVQTVRRRGNIASGTLWGEGAPEVYGELLDKEAMTSLAILVLKNQRRLDVLIGSNGFVLADPLGFAVVGPVPDWVLKEISKASA